MASIIHLEN